MLVVLLLQASLSLLAAVSLPGVLLLSLLELVLCNWIFFSRFCMPSTLVLPAHSTMVGIATKRHPTKNNTEQLPIYPAWL